MQTPWARENSPPQAVASHPDVLQLQFLPPSICHVRLGSGKPWHAGQLQCCLGLRETMSLYGFRCNVLDFWEKPFKMEAGSKGSALVKEIFFSLSRSTTELSQWEATKVRCKWKGSASLRSQGFLETWSGCSCPWGAAWTRGGSLQQVVEWEEQHHMQIKVMLSLEWGSWRKGDKKNVQKGQNHTAVIGK